MKDFIQNLKCTQNLFGINRLPTATRYSILLLTNVQFQKILARKSNNVSAIEDQHAKGFHFHQQSLSGVEFFRNVAEGEGREKAEFFVLQQSLIIITK